MARGLLDYFPLALAEVSKASAAGNDQHHREQPLHWDRRRSTDHADCLMRHLADRGTIDVDGQRHSAKVAWRALALLELELENAQASQEQSRAPDGVTPEFNSQGAYSVYIPTACLTPEEIDIIAKKYKQRIGYHD